MNGTKGLKQYFEIVGFGFAWFITMVFIVNGVLDVVDLAGKIVGAVLCFPGVIIYGFFTFKKCKELYIEFSKQ